MPRFVIIDGFDEVVGESDGIVGVLSGDGGVGFRVPVEFEDGDIDGSESLLSELYGTRYNFVIDECYLGVLGGDFEFGVCFWREAFCRGDGFVMTCVDDGVHVESDDARAGDEGGGFIFFPCFPLDELFDIWVVAVNDDHFCGPSRSSA